MQPGLVEFIIQLRLFMVRKTSKDIYIYLQYDKNNI
jgi:hypothetical protein